MKILVFSDSHLRLPFEEKKFKWLEKNLGQADQIIINGDFWDGYVITFNQFINSPWRHLFPLLKSKKTIYIYGNHDKKKFSNGGAEIFSNIQTTRHELKLNNKVFIFEHGDQIRPSLDGLLNFEKPPEAIMKKLRDIDDLMVKKFGKTYLKLMFSRRNRSTKKKLKPLLRQNQIFICGHNHYAEIDEKNQFANSGIILGGLAQYLLIEDGRMRLKEEWYD